MPNAPPLRSLTAALLPLLFACTEAATAPPLADPVTPASELRMHALIDGRTYTAFAPDGFGDLRIEVNKGGIELGADFAGVGQVDGPVNAADFTLAVAGSPDGGAFPPRVEFTRYDAFSGSLYWIAPGQAVEVWLGLYHRSAGHYDFGPYRVAVQRRAHDGVEPPPPP